MNHFSLGTMATARLGEIVRKIATLLARGDFDRTVAECSASRLSASDLRNVIQDYGRTLVEPPTVAYANLDAVAVGGSAIPTWSVRAPMWSKEEGRSDLTLVLTVTQDGERLRVELDDLHVL